MGTCVTRATSRVGDFALALTLKDCLLGILACAIFLASQVAHAQVAAFGFNEGTGTTTTNTAATTNNGTLTNATWITTGRIGNALSFNGTSARVDVGDYNAIDLTTSRMTLEA